ncbi:MULTISPECIES: hypothetical protein [Arthrobacter]|uniref:hypothetical protein n=1 Tax=Arthrobacter TaxID=1663 RepID=UPI001EF0E6EE|nr:MULTISPECIES: hypothetical protein [Arthrobacter]MDP9988295.1 putative RecA/RadA family phage recombinase [Arthrobacter oryzae]UKA71950.1 hypothetical protein LFT49_04200 [Arthrobacter sp. FW306-06-A]UKA76111.1 hypothetical protein LFT46_03335 [Arthrobacter sp. FW306-07-I]
MPEQHNTPAIGWLPAWADLHGRSAEAVNAGFVVGGGTGDEPQGQEYVAGWAGGDAEELAAKAAGEGASLTLLCADAGNAGDLAPGGLARVSERILLMAPTAELNTGVQLPENSQVALAPMETYDAVEITVFDSPVARGRVQVRDDFAAVAITEVPEGPEKETFERGLFAAMAEEAFLHGAEYLHMVVEADAAGPYEASGWTVAGRLVGFGKS